MVVTTGALVDRRYLVAELLGRGGMADVFLATDTATSRPVALKLLRGGDPVSTERFRSEQRVLDWLNHPAIVGLQGAGSHQGAPYLALDLVDGPSLAKLLVDGPFGIDRSTEMCAEIADALAQAHSCGIVHRDVKPGNILLDGNGHAHLTDFGIARLADSTGLTATGAVVGSPAYVAPEQLEGQLARPAADVYALGLVLFECLCGRPAYSGTPAEAALARLHRPPAIPTSLPAWLRELVRAMTTRDPLLRPSMEAVAESLRGKSIDLVLPATGPVLDRSPSDTVPNLLSLDPSGDLKQKPRQTQIPYRAALSAALFVGSMALGWIAGSHDSAPTDSPTQPAKNAPATIAPAPDPATDNAQPPDEAPVVEDEQPVVQGDEPVVEDEEDDGGSEHSTDEDSEDEGRGRGRNKGHDGKSDHD